MNSVVCSFSSYKITVIYIGSIQRCVPFTMWILPIQVLFPKSGLLKMKEDNYSFTQFRIRDESNRESHASDRKSPVLYTILTSILFCFSFSNIKVLSTKHLILKEVFVSLIITIITIHNYI